MDIIEDASSQMRQIIMTVVNTKNNPKSIVNNNKNSQSKMCPGLSQTSRMECFATIVTYFYPLNIAVKFFTLDVYKGPGCVPTIAHRSNCHFNIFVFVRTWEFPSSFDTFLTQRTYVKLYLRHVLKNVISS